MREGHEHIPQYVASTITLEEMVRRIIKDGHTDPRFEPRNRGSFAFSPLDSGTSFPGSENAYVSLLEENGVIVALAQLYKNPNVNELTLATVSVDKNKKGLKLSGKLLREVFRLAQQEKRKILVSNYTSEGNERLRHQIEALSKEFNVPIKTSER